jgi:hypothetical protein
VNPVCQRANWSEEMVAGSETVTREQRVLLALLGYFVCVPLRRGCPRDDVAFEVSDVR